MSPVTPVRGGGGSAAGSAASASAAAAAVAAAAAAATMMRKRRTGTTTTVPSMPIIHFAVSSANADRAHADGQVVEAAVFVGRRAVAPIWRSSPSAGPTQPPCAVCRMHFVVRAGPSEHGLRECWRGLSCACRKISSRRRPNEAVKRRTADACPLSSHACRSRRLSWQPAVEASGDLCFACFMLLVVRGGRDGLVPTHDAGGCGMWSCRWLHTVRVVLLQAVHARRRMSRTEGVFSNALEATCGVNWMRSPQNGARHTGAAAAAAADGSTMGNGALRGGGGGGGGGGDGGGGGSGASLATRRPPAELLDWGPNVGIAHDIDNFGRWLTDGATVPNLVLFAPVVAEAFGLQF